MSDLPPLFLFGIVVQYGGVLDIFSMPLTKGTTSNVVMIIKDNCLCAAENYSIVCMYHIINPFRRCRIFTLFSFLAIMTEVTVNMRKYLKSRMLSALAYAKEW